MMPFHNMAGIKLRTCLPNAEPNLRAGRALSMPHTHIFMKCCERSW